MKIVVTGGAGFIGSHVVDRCLTDGHEVVVIDNLSSGRRQVVAPGARLVIMDIRSPQLAQVFRAERPDAVVHLAAQAEGSRSVDDLLLDASVNVLGSLNLLQCCRRFGVARVIYASSGGAVYGDTLELPTSEDHPTHPVCPYGVSKVTVEHYLGCWPELHGLALRYATVYGPRQNPMGEAGVVAIFSHRLLRGLPVAINGDGHQTRDYVWVDDVVDANMAALERTHLTGVVNVGTGVETTVTELFDRVRAVVDLPAIAEHAPARPGEQRRSVLDNTRARDLLGWTPRVALDDGLRRTVGYFTAEAARAEDWRTQRAEV